MTKKLDPTQYHKTNNARGYMHPLSEIAQKFILASKKTTPVMDMGCAYGNTVIAAIEAGAKHVIACDMEQSHLDAILKQLNNQQLQHITIEQGQFPEGFQFEENSIGAIHASHVLAYLNGSEVDAGLEKFYYWLKPNGQLYILCYTIFMKELVNDHFQNEYHHRIRNAEKWPGYLVDFNHYSEMPNDESISRIDSNALPKSLHVFELPFLVNALTKLGFIIEFADYLDGSKNGAVEETWHDGREYLGIIARKSD